MFKAERHPFTIFDKLLTMYNFVENNRNLKKNINNSVNAYKSVEFLLK